MCLILGISIHSMEMSILFGTDFAFGLNRFGLTLVEFTNGLTAPQDVAHSWVAHAHHAHRYQVGEHGENDVVSTFENIPSCQCLSTTDPQVNICYNLMALYITWNLVARLTEAHPARRRYKQFEFHRLNICGMKIIKWWNIIFTHIIFASISQISYGCDCFYFQIYITIELMTSSCQPPFTFDQRRWTDRGNPKLGHIITAITAWRTYKY